MYGLTINKTYTQHCYDSTTAATMRAAALTPLHTVSPALCPAYVSAPSFLQLSYVGPTSSQKRRQTTWLLNQTSVNPRYVALRIVSTTTTCQTAAGQAILACCLPHMSLQTWQWITSLFRLVLSFSGNTRYTHRPQGVKCRGHLRVFKSSDIYCLKKGVMQTGELIVIVS